MPPVSMKRTEKNGRPSSALNEVICMTP